MVIVVRRRPRWYATRSSPRSQAGRTLVSSSSLLPFLFLTSSSSPDPALAYPENDQGSSCVPGSRRLVRSRQPGRYPLSSSARAPAKPLLSPSGKKTWMRASFSDRGNFTPEEAVQSLTAVCFALFQSPSRSRSPPGASFPRLRGRLIARNPPLQCARACVCVCFRPLGFFPSRFSVRA